MQRTIERLRCKMSKTNRIVVASVLAFGLLLGLFSALLSLDVVTIVDSNGDNQVLITTSREAQEILALAGVETGTTDEIIYVDNGKDGTNILVNRSFPINIVADGNVYTTDVVNGTVAEALKICGLALLGEDFVEPGLNTELQKNMVAVVKRVDYYETTTRMEVHADDVAAYRAKLLEENPGADFTESKSRIYDATVRHKLVNDEVSESELLSLSAVYHPYDAPSGGFQPGTPVSTIDSFLGVELGADGVPTEYSRLMSGAVCTAYSASAGRGAGGQGLYCGTVAVNPNVIPYGTRLYIASADGSFVYGYAIASDCGTAMMEGYVDVDLYFESNAECRSFGKRLLNVYILD